MDPNTNIADQNTERLIQAAYQPEPVPPQFATALEARLIDTAQTLAKQVRPAARTSGARRWPWVAVVLGGMAACILIAWAISSFQGIGKKDEPDPAPAPPIAKHNPPIEEVKPVPANLPRWTEDVREGMQPRVRPEAPKLAGLKVGQAIATRAGERRLVQLGDGTRLYVNEKTEVEATADRQLTLHKGQIYVEVAPGEPSRVSDRVAHFSVKAAHREIVATGTHFAVTSDPVASGVTVTQGKVAVKDALTPDSSPKGRGELEVAAGQRLAPGAKEITPAPRASHALEWTRALMAAAESPMVPSCQHGGGALLAIDPNGQEIKLALRQYHVDVHIEDGFARTTIDQTYFNTTWDRLEGTFYFPLPADASLSRLAMYVVDGNQCKLMEGGMAERKHAADVYETIRYQRRDPALLEWLDGTTFKMRVFPLEAKQEKRILLSYTQKLPSLYGNMRYRFPGGHSLPAVREWSFNARVKSGASMNIWSPSHDDMVQVMQAGDILTTLYAKNVEPKRDVWLEMQPREAAVEKDVPRFASFLYENHQYLMLRYRPTLPSLPERQRRDWIVLFESSAQRDPLLAGTQVDIVKQFLRNVEYDDTFTLLTVNSKVAAYDPGEPSRVSGRLMGAVDADSTGSLRSSARLDARPKNVDDAIAYLNKTHLVGALDLQQGLEAGIKLAKNAKNPHILHVGSGIPAMGERDAGKLAKLLPENVPYVGVGVGKRWNRAFMKAAAERTNGLFTQINPDETIAWRAFEVLSTLNTPRLLDVQVLDANGKARFLLDSTLIAQGEEICAITRVDTNQTAIPGKVIVKGKFSSTRPASLAGRASDGGPDPSLARPANEGRFEREFVVVNVLSGAGYLPRTWAKHEIDRLLADNAAKHKNDIINLSKAMYVMSPFTSLLVLETDADYERFKVDKGRKDHWAMYQVPPRIPLVYEPDGKAPPKEEKKDERKDKKPSVDEVLRTLAYRATPALVYPVGDLMIQDVDPAAMDIEVDIFSRLGEVSVPGLVNPNEAVGILNDYPTARSLELPTWFGRGGVNGVTVFGRPSTLLRGAGTELAVRTKAGSKTSERPDGLTPVKEKEALKRKQSFLTELGLQDDGKREPEVLEALSVKRPLSITHEVQDITRRISNKAVVINGRDPLDVTVTKLSGKRLEKAGFLGANVLAGERIQFAPVFVAPQMHWAAPDNTFIPGLTPALPMPAPPIWAGEKEKLPDRNSLFSFGLGIYRDDDKESRPSVTTASYRYERPTLNYDRGYFTDLVQYAPGLHSTLADVLAVLEAEADVVQPKLGAIDAVARQLIEQARSSEWSALTIQAYGPLPGWKIAYNQAGQFAYQRVLASGLREEVVCDGKTLWHLYPEIGLGATRLFSWHHLTLMSSFNPAFLPSAEELARGYNVRALDTSTIALIPLTPNPSPPEGRGEKDKYHRVHLVFAAGRLAERRVVEMPLGKIVLKQILSADGNVDWQDAEGKSLARQARSVARTLAPNLAPRTSELVVMEMPLRSRGYWLDRWAKEPKTRYVEQCIVSECMTGASGSASVMIHFGTHFHQKGDRRLGFYTLLNACGYSIVNENLPPVEMQASVRGSWSIDIEKEHPNNALATFLAQAQRELVSNDQSLIKKIDGGADGFIQKLAHFRNLWLTWHNQRPLLNGGQDLPLEKAKVLEFLQETTAPAFGYAILDAMQRRSNTAPSDHMLETAAKRLGPLSDPLGLGYVLRYEHARSLWQAGKGAESAKAFRELHGDTLKYGVLPPIDPAFRDSLQLPIGAGPRFIAHTRKTLEELLGKKRYSNAFQLAKQMEQLGDEALSDEILTTVLAKASKEERNALTVVCIHFLAERKNFVQADRLLVKLLEDKKLAQYAELWRWRVELTKNYGQTATSIACLEKALELEYADLPEILNLESIRTDYRALLQHYQKIAEASASLEKSATKIFLGKVIRTADRWRLLDADASEPSTLAGKILYTMGERELAWDYWTTPIDLHPAESAPWLQLAETMRGEGDLKQADRAFGLAFEAEPTNPEILWRRAQNAVRMGEPEQARQLYRQIADGDWQERFRSTVEQARGLAAQ